MLRWVGACLFLASAAGAAPRYTISDLGLVNRYGSSGNAINQSGAVAGETYSFDGLTTHGYLYSSGTLNDIGALAPGDFDHSAAFGINDVGQAVGYSFPHPFNGGSPSHAIRYDQGALIDLGTLVGRAGFSVAYDINNLGIAVGQSSTAANSEHAVTFSVSGVTDLGTLGGDYSAAYGLADSGEIVGQSDTADGKSQAFTYRDGVMTDIGLDGQNSGAFAVNESGAVAGFINRPDEVQQGFIYRDGTLKQIGALVPGGLSGAFGINNLGQVVGFSDAGAVNTHAVLYVDGFLLDLNQFIDPLAGWELTGAMAINDAGQIVGSGIFDGGINHAFLLTPLSVVPEPATWFLLIGGFILIGLTSRRRSTRRVVNRR